MTGAQAKEKEYGGKRDALKSRVGNQKFHCLQKEWYQMIYGIIFHLMVLEHQHSSADVRLKQC